MRKIPQLYKVFYLGSFIGETNAVSEKQAVNNVRFTKDMLTPWEYDIDDFTAEIQFTEKRYGAVKEVLPKSQEHQMSFGELLKLQNKARKEAV